MTRKRKLSFKTIIQKDKVGVIAVVGVIGE